MCVCVCLCVFVCAPVFACVQCACEWCKCMRASVVASVISYSNFSLSTKWMVLLFHGIGGIVVYVNLEQLRNKPLGSFIMVYITLSHLRSKEFLRIHLPCIPLYRETSKCTPVYIEMYPRKVVALLKEQATFMKAGMALMWMGCWYRPLFVLYKLRSKSIVGINAHLMIAIN